MILLDATSFRGSRVVMIEFRCNKAGERGSKRRPDKATLARHGQPSRSHLSDFYPTEKSLPVDSDGRSIQMSSLQCDLLYH